MNTSICHRLLVYKLLFKIIHPNSIMASSLLIVKFIITTWLYVISYLKSYLNSLTSNNASHESRVICLTFYRTVWIDIDVIAVVISKLKKHFGGRRWKSHVVSCRRILFHDSSKQFLIEIPQQITAAVTALPCQASSRQRSADTHEIITCRVWQICLDFYM